MENLARVLRMLKVKAKGKTINIIVNIHDFETDEEVDKMIKRLPIEFTSRESSNAGTRWVYNEAKKFDGFGYVDITIFRPYKKVEPVVEPTGVPF